MFPRPMERRPGGIPPPANQQQQFPASQSMARQGPQVSDMGAQQFGPPGVAQAPQIPPGQIPPEVAQAVPVGPAPIIPGRYQSPLQAGMPQGGPPQFRPQQGMAANPAQGGMGAGQMPMSKRMPAPWGPQAQAQQAQAPGMVPTQPGVGMNRPSPQGMGVPQAARLRMAAPQPMARPQTLQPNSANQDQNRKQNTF